MSAPAPARGRKGRRIIMMATKERILIISENGLFGESIKNLLLHARPTASVRIVACKEATTELVATMRPDVAIFVKDSGGGALDDHCLSLIKTLESRVILCTLEDNQITILQPTHLFDVGVEALIRAVWQDEPV